MSTVTHRRSLGGPVTTGGATAVRPQGGAAPRDEVLQEQEPPRRGVASARAWWTHVRSQPQAGWTVGHALLTRVLHAALIGSMMCGPVGLWVAVHANQGGVPVAATAGYDERAESRRSAAEHLAREWVIAWLSAARGQEASLNGYLSQRVELPEQGAIVQRAEVISALPADVGVWAVTVQTDLAPLPKAGVVRRYYRVPIQVQGEGERVSAAVMALPAQVPPPVVTSAAAQPYAVPVEVDSPLGSSVNAFVQAAISGRADEVARYSTPGRDVQAALDPAQGAYASAKVTKITATEKVDDPRTGQVPADGAVARVQADVDLVEKGAAREQGRPATWFLTLTTRAGRWEVSAVDPSPQIPAGETTPNEGEEK